MRRRAIRKTPRKYHIKKIVVIIGVIAAIIGAGTWIYKFFIINEIKCQSQYGPCSVATQDALGSAKGKNYFAAKKEIESKFEKGIMVSQFSVILNAPHQLKVTVIERKAIGAAAREDNLKALFYIDDNGYAVSQSEMTNLPILIIKQNLQLSIGQKVDSPVLFGIKILREVQNTYTVKIAYMETDSIVVPLSNGLTAMFPLEGDSQVLMGALGLILSRLNTDSHAITINESGLVPKIIDLRFKNPVLR